MAIKYFVYCGIFSMNQEQDENMGILFVHVQRQSNYMSSAQFVHQLGTVCASHCGRFLKRWIYTVRKILPTAMKECKKGQISIMPKIPEILVRIHMERSISISSDQNIWHHHWRWSTYFKFVAPSLTKWFFVFIVGNLEME